MYNVTVNISGETFDGYTGTCSLPTFCIDENIQGFAGDLSGDCSGAIEHFVKSMLYNLRIFFDTHETSFPVSFSVTATER